MHSDSKKRRSFLALLFAAGDAKRYVLYRFMEEMIAVRYNLWWYLSLFVPALIMLTGTFWNKRYLLIIAIIFSLVSTYTLCNISVREKWKVRYEIAKTSKELDYASADGANLVFTAIFIGPFEAILYTTIWGVIGRVGWKKLKIKRTLET